MVPSVEVTPLSERNLDVMIQKSDMSNWRLVKHRKEYVIASHARHWSRFVILIMAMIQVTHRKYSVDYEKAFTSSGFTNLNDSYYQDFLE